MVDADGATDINDLEKVLNSVKLNANSKGLGCAIGSRNAAETKVQRKGVRKFLNWGMQTLVRFVLGFDVKDT